MAADNLNNMDVNALLALRADVDRMLAERGRDLQCQLALLSEGHSLEEFSVGSAGSKVAPTAAKKLVAKRGRKPASQKGGRKRGGAL